MKRKQGLRWRVFTRYLSGTVLTFILETWVFEKEGQIQTSLSHNNVESSKQHRRQCGSGLSLREVSQNQNGFHHPQLHLSPWPLPLNCRPDAFFHVYVFSVSSTLWQRNCSRELKMADILPNKASYSGLSSAKF